MKNLKRGSSSHGRAWLPLLALGVIAWCLSACTAGQVKTPGIAPTAEQLLDLVRAKSADLKTFAGRGGLKIKDREREHYFEVMIAAAQPDCLRIQAFDFIGRPIMTLLAKGDDLRYLDYRQARLVYGQATPENMRRIFPVAVRVPELIGILSGAPVVPAFEHLGLVADRVLGYESWGLTLSLPGGQWIDRFWLTRPDNLLRRVERGPANEEAILRLDYGDFRAPTGAETSITPYHVSAADLKARTELIIDYQEIKINPTLPESLFTLPTPAGVRSEPMTGAEGGT